MRLIDAKQFEGRYFIGEGEIEKAPTVEAIPIEILRDWQKLYGNKCTYGHIMRLVNLWEAENETN